MQKKFYFFRHGQTDWNLEKRCQGHTDIPLNDLGRQQAERLADILIPHHPEHIYSSDLSRARETAEIFQRCFPIPLSISLDNRLREAHFGVAEGMLVEDSLNHFAGDIWESFRKVDLESHQSFPQGESPYKVAQRLKSFIASTLNCTRYRSVAISTHGWSLRCFIQLLCPEFGEVSIPNCVVYELIYDKKKWAINGPW